MSKHTIDDLRVIAQIPQNATISGLTAPDSWGIGLRDLAIGGFGVYHPTDAAQLDRLTVRIAWRI